MSRLLLLFAVLLASPWASAQMKYTWQGNPQWFSSSLAACDAYVAAKEAGSGYAICGGARNPSLQEGQPYCIGVHSSDCNISLIYKVDEAPPCPATDVGGMSVTMMHTSGPSLGSAIVGGPYTTPDRATSQSFCPPTGCTVKPKGPPTSCSQSPTPDSKGYYGVYCNYDMAQTGGSCTPGGGNVPSLDPPSPSGTNNGDGKCPPGTVAAGTSWSGMTNCVGDGKSDPKPPTTTGEKPPVTTPNPDGGTTTTTEKTTTNADGSTTTTTTTKVTNPDGSTSTTVSSDTRKPDGTAGAEDKPDSDLCKQNPRLTICQNSQVLGKCGEISCTGDAIQCATLRAAAAMECRQKDDIDEVSKSAVKAAGEAILRGADPMAVEIGNVMKGTTVDLSGEGQFKQDQFFPSACFGSKSFTVMGRTVVVSFAQVCSDIQPLRYVILSLSFIVAYLFVGRAVLQG